MQWFRHYTNAGHSTSLNLLVDAMGLEGLAIYWLFVEYCASKWDGCSEPKFEISLSDLKQYLGIRQPKLEQYLSISQTLFLFCSTIVEYRLVVEFPKLLELQDKYQKYNSKRVVSRSQVTTLYTDTDTETETEKKPPVVLLKKSKAKSTRSRATTTPSAPQIFFNGTNFENLDDETFKKLAQAYPLVAVDLEIKKMELWRIGKPEKKYSNDLKFITNWLSRSEEKISKTITPPPPEKWKDPWEPDWKEKPYPDPEQQDTKNS